MLFEVIQRSSYMLKNRYFHSFIGPYRNSLEIAATIFYSTTTTLFKSILQDPLNML